MATQPQQDRSPSPSGPPPVAVTPGPRAIAVNKLFTETLKATLRTCSYQNFSKCFPTPAEKTPKVLKAVHEQIVGKIETKAVSEFEQIMKERNVIEGLNTLENLIDEGKRRQQSLAKVSESIVPPHELPANDLYNAHLSPLLVPMQKQLEEQLQATQARNLELAEQIRKQRDEMEQIVSSLEATIHDLEGANKVLEGSRPAE